MADKCGSCDCSDKSQCVYTTMIVMDVPEAAENDGKCKCGTSCACTDCTCGH
ncbi:hypothetical protein DH2020_031662 [Rehmannia glutinosa]|uniref:Metallothionein-like protein n=1 Tax=Rehmannia glutinosa TaxID=99300 RepID=A0ABR0VHF5_REHGL